ncbi:MAG: universal stress protein [Polyangiales bacterium]
MLNWKTILVPTDFSEGSRQALRIASELAQAHSAKLHILHVTELPPGLDTGTMIAPAPGGIPVTIVDFAREQALAWMNQDREHFVTQGLDADISIEVGSVVDTVLDTAERVRADLIVVGTHGRTGFAHFVLGSVAERIVRRSPVPVLTVRQQSDSSEAQAVLAPTPEPAAG